MQQEKRHAMPWTLLLSAALLIFSAMTTHLCIPPMEHIIKEELHLTHAQTSLLFVIPMAMMSAFAIPGGLLADRIGIRKAAGIGAIIVAVGALLRGTVTSFPPLLAFSALGGVGGALTVPNLPKMVSLEVPRERAGIATGIYSTGMAFGGAVPITITIPLIYPLTDSIQGTFMISSIPSIIAATMWWILTRNTRHSKAPVQASSHSNLTFRQIFNYKSLLLVAILFFLGQFFFMNWSAWSPALMLEKGAAADVAGYISSMNFWVALPTVLLIPLLAYRLGRRKPFILFPPVIMALSALWAIYANLSMSWPLMALVGICNNILFVTLMALPVEIMPRESVGTASGLIMCIGSIGGVIGTVIGGHILDLTGSLNLSLTILIGMATAAAVIASRIPETAPKASLIT